MLRFNDDIFVVRVGIVRLAVDASVVQVSASKTSFLLSWRRLVAANENRSVEISSCCRIPKLNNLAYKRHNLKCLISHRVFLETAE